MGVEDDIIRVMKTDIRSFHLPLPHGLYDDLRAEARRRGRPATVIAREAIEQGLRERRRQELREEIAEYARAHAGTPADLDSDLELASLESLRRKERKK
jgi:predicted DNA-binding protein